MSSPWPLSAVARASSITRCTWCGHPTHTDTCDRDIQTQNGKKPETTPCPCTARAQHPTSKEK